MVLDGASPGRNQLYAKEKNKKIKRRTIRLYSDLLPVLHNLVPLPTLGRDDEIEQISNHVDRGVLQPVGRQRLAAPRLQAALHELRRVQRPQVLRRVPLRADLQDVDAEVQLAGRRRLERLERLARELRGLGLDVPVHLPRLQCALGELRGEPLDGLGVVPCAGIFSVVRRRAARLGGDGLEGCGVG